MAVTGPPTPPADPADQAARAAHTGQGRGALGVDGYWCELVARSRDAGAEWFLGGCRAGTPEAAMAWLRAQAVRVAGALDPRPGDRPFPARCLRPAAADTPGEVFRDWLADHAYQRTQAATLTAGRPVSVNAVTGDRIAGHGGVCVLYSLTCRPIATTATVRPTRGAALCITP